MQSLHAPRSPPPESDLGWTVVCQEKGAISATGKMELEFLFLRFGSTILVSQLLVGPLDKSKW